MAIPTEPVGSLPRPKYLQDAFADYDAGKISREELLAAQDKDSAQRSEQTGAEFITDGEKRASSFATYPIIDTLSGKGLAPNLAAGGQYVPIFDDEHHRQLPRLVKGSLEYNTYAAEYYTKSKSFAKKANLKQAVIAPSMLYWIYHLLREVEGYPREEFVKDLVNECEKDIGGLFDAAKRVGIDFIEGRLASKKDPWNP